LKKLTPDELGKVSDLSEPKHDRPTLTRPAMGAEAIKNIAKALEDVTPEIVHIQRRNRKL